jgi:hypothetical protein
MRAPQQAARTLPHFSAERNTSNHVGRLENRGKCPLEGNAVTTKQSARQCTVGPLMINNRRKHSAVSVLMPSSHTAKLVQGGFEPASFPLLN